VSDWLECILLQRKVHLVAQPVGSYTHLCWLFVDKGVDDEENLEYARRLMRAGVPTELHVYPGAVHGFDIAAGAKVSQSAMRDRLDALARALSRS